MELLNPRGMTDCAPEEMILKQEVIDRIRRVFEIYGYSPLETPLIERYEVLAAKFGAGGWNQISAAIATMGGQVLDIDLNNWGDVDARIEAVGAANVGVILIVGGPDVVPFSEFPNTPGDCSVHPQVYESDDHYGDFDHDGLTLVDVPVARIPDGDDLNLVLAQLSPTRTPAPGSYLNA